jgi:hypothetical protein
MALLSISLFSLQILTSCNHKGASPVRTFKSANKTASDTDSLLLVRPFIRTQALDKSPSSNHKGKDQAVIVPSVKSREKSFNHRSVYRPFSMNKKSGNKIFKDTLKAKKSSMEYCTDKMETSASTHLKIRTREWSVEVSN